MKLVTFAGRLSLTVIGAAVISFNVGGSAHAASLSSGSWTSFDFAGPGSPSNPSTFDFTSSTGGDTLKVTDAFLKGDIFKIFDFSTLLGSTSTVPSSFFGTTDDPDAAFADPTYSHGSFFLSSGVHSISIIASASPFGSGGAYIRRDPGGSTAVPTPALLPGLIGLGVGVLRKRKAEAAKRAIEV